MSGEAAVLEPQYVRLSGEVADQTLLDSLRAVYPNARIAHAFASTEAGVAFDVNDGLAGFPLAFIDNPATSARHPTFSSAMTAMSIPATWSSSWTGAIISEAAWAA